MDSLPIIQHSSTALLPTSLLPTEVIEDVIDQASDNAETLRRLALLCKSLLTRARFHLFTSIVIRTVEQMESSRDFLDLHPWIPPLVQKVTLAVRLFPELTFKPNIPLLDIIRLHLFTRFPNLRSWAMRTEGLSARGPQLSLHPSTLLCYRLYGGRIQDLELAELAIEDVSHFIRLISSFTRARRITCSKVILRKKLQTRLHDSMVLNRLVKPLKIQHLSIDTLVDIRLVECLLGSSVATLESFTIALANTYMDTYLERLEESMSRLSNLASLELVLVFPPIYSANHANPSNGVQQIRWATRLLQSASSLVLKLGDTKVQIKSSTIACLGCTLSRGSSPPLDTCHALEAALLVFPACKIQFGWPESDRRRAGAPEFWSPIVASAFPKLNERGLLSKLPSSRPSDPLGHENGVSCLVASPDSRWIVTASWDGTVIVWDVERGAVEQEWLAHWGSVLALSFSPDSRRLVSAGGQCGETLVLWDLGNLPLGVRKVAVLASIDVSDRGPLRMRDNRWVTDDSDMKKRDGTSVIDCAWSPDGTLIASAYKDGAVRVWDALTFQQRSQAPSHDTETLRNIPEFLRWTQDSRYLVHLAQVFPVFSTPVPPLCDGLIIWRPFADVEEPPKKLAWHPSLPQDYSICAISFDPGSKCLAAALRRRRAYPALNASAAGDMVEGDGTLNAHSGYVVIWDIESGSALTFLGHAEGVREVSFSPDGRSLLSVATDGSMKIWETESWQEVSSLEGDGRKSWTPTACFSPDGKYIATISNDRDTSTYAVSLWRAGAASCMVVSTEHEHAIKCMALSPDGEFLASGDDSGIVHIRPLSSLTAHLSD